MSVYQPPIVTTDAVVLRAGADGLELVTIVRERDPFAGRRALPGAYIAAGETIDSATVRLLDAKAGLRLDERVLSETVTVYDAVGRDPRGHAISIVTMHLCPPDFESDGWSPAGRRLAFDHTSIVATVTGRLADGLLHHGGWLRALHGSGAPTTRSLLAVYRAVTGDDPSPSNFRRRLHSSGIVAETDEMVADGPGRPATLWRWVD